MADTCTQTSTDANSTSCPTQVFTDGENDPYFMLFMEMAGLNLIS